jgi:NAD(P)-dependent dehydrogenase (short-subunit alcohol dehydrogenase family)
MEPFGRIFMSEKMRLTGKTVVVTGASSGIGLAAATALAAQGAWVIGVGRDPQRCQTAAGTILATVPGAQVDYLIANLSLQSEVRRLAGDIRSKLGENGRSSLDVLVNSAGTYSDRYVETPDGVELTLAVNHYAHFLLTHELLPLLQAAERGRVITVSSQSHMHTWLNPKRLNKPQLVYNGLWAYKLSKLANLLFTLEFNRRMVGASLRAFAVDPGLVNTDIGLKGTHGLSALVWRMRQRSGVQPEVPARTILYLASEPSLQDATTFYWYDLKPKFPSQQAQNPQTAHDFWETSCRMCGINA